jgi:phage-related minor tail protein
MSTEERKVQLGVEVDSTKARKGFGEVKEAGRDMSQSVSRSGHEAAKGVDEIGAIAARSSQKLDRATRSIVASIQRATAAAEAGGRGTTKFYEAIASQRGINADILKPYLTALGEAEKKQLGAQASLTRTGLSARETAFALRQVPMQFTDIFTSLASGQRPMMVMLQQGGQLKDMFGGLGPAVKAMGGYVLGLVNPITLTVAAAAGLATAFYQGAEESRGLARAIALTGNAAGATVSQLNAIAAAVGTATGATQGAAADAVEQLVATGQVATQNIGLVATTAVSMERATGQAVKETVKQFVELAKEPASASAKLNEQYNYLTTSVYRQIKALEDQGRATEAAALAQKAFADALADRAGKVDANLGTLERSWRGLKDAAKGAWDAMLDIGREDSTADKIQSKAAEVEALRSRMATLQAGGVGDSLWAGLKRSQLATAEGELATLKKLAAEESRRATEQERQNVAQKAGIDLLKESEKYLDKQAQKKKAIAHIEGLYAQSMKDSSAQEARRLALAGIDEKFTDKAAAKESGQAATQEWANRLKAVAAGTEHERALVEQAHAAGLTSAEQYQENLYRVEVAGLGKRAAVLQAQLDASKDKSDRLKLTGELAEVQAHALKAADAYQLALARMAKAERDFWEQGRQEMTRAAADELDATLKKAAAAEEENRRIGLTAGQLTQLTASRYDEIIAKREEAAESLRGNEARAGELFYIEQQIEALRRLKAAEVVRPQLEAQARAWDNFTRDIESSLTDALMRGFEAGNGFGENFVETLKNTLKTAGLKILVQAVVEPTMGAVRELGGGGMPSFSSLADGSALSKLTGSASGLWGLINGSTINGGFASLAESAAGANLGLSAQVPGLMGPTQSGAALSGYQLTDLGKGIGSGLATAGAGIMGAAIGGAIAKDYRIADGVSGAVAGAGIGALIGPLGSFAGGILGGIADRAFGMGKVELGGAGVQGTFAGSGFQGQGYQDWTQKGGWFQSDKSGTRYSAMDSGAQSSLGNAFGGIKAQVSGLAASLKVETSAIAGYSKTIRQALDAGSVSALMDGMANDMAALALAGTNYGKSGEAALATLTRLSTSLGTFNGWMERLGLTLADVSLAGGNASSKLIDLLGGVEEFARKEAAYFDAYYSQSEKMATLQGDIAAKLGSAGLAVPETKADYRTLVAQANPMTDSGRMAHAALIEMAPAFDALDKMLAESAAAAADALVGAFTADGRLAPGLAAFETAMAGMAETAAGAATGAGAISTLFLDASSGLLAFGEATADLTTAQDAAVALGDAMDAMRTAARAGTVDFNGLAKALHGVDTRTFMGALGKVFDGLADRLGGVVKDIAGLRTDLRADALRIADPVLMLPETILREIGTVGTTLPSMDALNNASAALAAADAAVASAGNTLASASTTMGSAYSTWQSYAGSAAAANSSLTTKVAEFQAISGKSIPNHDAGYWNAALMDAQWSATNYGNTLSSYNPENVYVYDGGWQTLATESGVTSTIDPLVTAFNAAVAAADARLAAYNATVSPYNAASSSYSGAVSNQTAKSSIVQAETLAYSDALNAFALQAERGVAKLSRLRTETMKYYDAQSRLAELMKSSADGLRGAVAQYRFDQLDEMQKYNALQSDYATSYSLALSTTDDTLAGYADKMTSLLPSMLEAARSVLGDTQYSAIAATALARASAIADRVDALTPTDYAAESLAALEQIDLTLSALEDSAMTANQAIVKAIEAGKELTAAGLRNVVTALGKTPTFATGGYHVGGLRIVGERGPELEATGPSRIWSASQTRALLAPAGGSSDPAMLAELQALRREVENLRAEARATATATAKTSRQLERFEIDGLTVRTEADSPLATVAA